MSVVQMNPCILSDRWAEVVEWAARIFDLPVSCRFDNDGWARLAAPSDGIKLVDPARFGAAVRGQLALELEVRMLRRVIERARDAGAKVLTEPSDGPDGVTRAAIETPHGIVLWLWDDRTPSKTAPDAHTGPVHFTVNRELAAPPARVFEAITRKPHLEAFFVSTVTGDLAKDTEVVWHWEGHGQHALHRTELAVNQFLSFTWNPGSQSYATRVQFALRPSARGTELAITESGWSNDARDLKQAFDNCEGWTTFLANLALYLEHDISAMKS